MAQSTSLRFKKFAEEGELTVEHFEIATETTPDLKDGEVRSLEGNFPIQYYSSDIICLPRCCFVICTYPATRLTESTPRAKTQYFRVKFL